jgi:hypothetical protein
MAEAAQGQTAPTPVQSPSGKKFSMANVVNKVQTPPQAQQAPQPQAQAPQAPAQPVVQQQAPQAPQQPQSEPSATVDIPLSLFGESVDTPPVQQAPAQPQAPSVDPDANIDTSQWAQQQREAFIRGRQREAALKQELAAIKEQLAKAPQNQQPQMPVNPFEDPAVKARLQEAEIFKQKAEHLETEMAKINVQYDPRFKAEFDIPREEKLALAVNYLSAYGKDREFAETLESVGIKERIEILNKEAPQLMAAVLPVFSELDMLKAKKGQVLNSATDMQKRYATQREEQIKQMKAQQYVASMKELQATGHFVYMDEAELSKHAPALVPISRKIKENASMILNSNDPAIVTTAAMMGAAAPLYLQELKKQSKIIAQQAADIAKMSALSPSSGGSQGHAGLPHTPAGAKSQANQGKSFMERQVAAAQASVSSR